MEAVLKQGNRISPRRFQQHPRAADRRFLSPSSTTRTKLAGLGEAISKHFWTQFKTSKIDYNAWSYSLRTGCAACLALYIAFALNLDGCHWAFTTCYIVGAQRLKGKILAKSLARVVGTFVGAIASFVLVNAFAQHGVLFITWFAVWLSLCAIGSHTRRDDWAYAWVLSGYTTAIVGIPAALAPESAFDIISSRAEDILIGILCVAGVGMIASRELVGPRVKKLIASMDKDLSVLLSISYRSRQFPTNWPEPSKSSPRMQH
jgi:fusaric acid resistance family protein